MKNLSYAFFVSLLALGACSSSGDEPECDALCDRTPTATPIQGACVSDFITRQGYNTDHPDCVRLSEAFAAGTATAGMCRTCYDAINVSGSDCAAAESLCFGGGMPDSGPGLDSGPMPGDDAGPGLDSGPADPDAGPGDPDAGPGDPDAGPGDVVTTCAQACALTPEASAAEGLCTTEAVEGLGYDTDNIPCDIFGAAFAAGIATPDQCNACYGAISITDEDCATVHAACF